VSKRNHKAIFESKSPRDEWSGARETWTELTREWISLEPFALFGQRQEFIESNQTTGTRKFKASLVWSPTAATITNDIRMKIRKPVAVNENEPEHDSNFRLFEIENIVNPGEMNRELELMVQEKV
jgi:hypothetical protein